MDYDQALHHVGKFGKYQKVIIAMLVVPVIFNAGSTYFFNFILGNHLHRCERPDVSSDKYELLDDDPGNVTSMYNATKCTLYYNGTETQCSKWVYDQSVYKSTLISKFNMVCEESFSRTHILSAFFVGQTFGGMGVGVLTDVVGRKPVIFGSVVLLLISNVITPLMPAVWLVALCQVFNAAASTANYSITVVLVTEMVCPSHRVLVSFCTYLSYCVGEFVLLFEGYFLREHSYLIYAVSLPFSVCLFIFMYVPESPRWLISKGRYEQARAVLKKMASVNKEDFNINVEQLFVKTNTSLSFTITMKRIMASKTMLSRLFILMLTWFSLNLIYFGVSMNVGDLAGNVYVNFAISSSVETLAVLICYFANKCSRRRLIAGSMLLGSCSCLSSIFISIFGDKNLHWITTGLAMIGKFGASIAFFMVFLITAEMFPTVMRTTLLGICMTSGKLGAFLSAYIGKLGVLLDTPLGLSLPLVIFGSIGIVAGVLDLFLPETRNIKLPDTIHDITKDGKTEVVISESTYI